jgi:DNA-binding transcriptional ArsR family regulator
MGLARFDEEGRPVPPLRPDQFLQCVECDATYVASEIDAMHYGEGDMMCLGCGGFKGFVARKAPVAESERRLRARWGEAGRKFTALPDALIAHAPQLGLNSIDLHLILILERHRWEAGEAVFPGVGLMQRLSGISHGTIRAHLQKLERMGLIEIEPRRRKNGSQTSNDHTVTGLVEAVGLIARNEAEGEPSEKGLDSLLARLAEQGATRQEARLGRRTHNEGNVVPLRRRSA